MIGDWWGWGWRKTYFNGSRVKSHIGLSSLHLTSFELRRRRGPTDVWLAGESKAPPSVAETSGVLILHGRFPQNLHCRTLTFLDKLVGFCGSGARRRRVFSQSQRGWRYTSEFLRLVEIEQPIP